MVKIIMGLKGSGKTKQLIELVNTAVKEEDGEVICVEKGQKLRYEIPRSVRLIEASDYSFSSYEFLKGFISGLYAANYDITHIFIDSALRIIDQPVDHKTEDFLDWCESFSERENVKFTITISADATLATDGIKKYF
ncbi:MAG: hypothetical protein GX847_08245 [Clostridiales bacterium]|nr:hypothetical protein [Clostridiales bacterium]